MEVIAQLAKWFERRPLLLLRFENGFEQDLRASRRGLDWFTITKRHSEFDGFKLPTLCIAEMPNGATANCFVGVVKSKGGVATFESRISVIALQKLKLDSLVSLQNQLKGTGFENSFKDKLGDLRFAAALTPKLSEAVIKALASDPDNGKAIRVAAANIPKFLRISPRRWQQSDAIKTALAAFGFSKGDHPGDVAVAVNSDSTLQDFDAHVLEDNVIARDASIVPGFSLIDKHVTGRAVFQKGNEQLIVYTANKGPLEEMLGVDLVYVNTTIGNTVMLQYKMLEPYTDPATSKTDWILRPDGQLAEEISRMKLPGIKSKIEDYRLHRDPFFFKLVRRKGDGESHKSVILSFDHLHQLLGSEKCKGPKGGTRISYTSLEGIYLREPDLIGLIRSGYIGTHRVESQALHTIIAEVANGNRALVLAWQERVAAAADDED